MGCSHSKAAPGSVHKLPTKALDSCRIVETPADAAAVADMTITGWMERQPVHALQATTIQDLPPLLLAHIFSKYLTWEDVQGSVSLVCQSWHQIAAEVTPHQLSFEFDLVEDRGNSSTESKSEAKTLLQALLSQPTRLLQRLTGQLRPAQQQQDTDDDDPLDQDPSTDPSTSAADALQHQQFLQYLQNAPWERWLYQHGTQLQDFSMSITNLDSNCAAAQCQLKETLLRALADSATPKSPLSTSTNSSSTSASASASATPRVSDSSSQASTSAPGTPLSSACSEFSLSCSSDSNAESCSSSTSSTTSALQLKSLHLKVPLFECDVLLLAHGVCAKAPDLKALSLVGYSSSSAVKTRSSTSLSTLTGSRSSRHRLPINRPKGGRAAATLAAQAAAATAAGGRASPRGGDLIPVGHADPNSLPPIQANPWAPSPGSGRGGFITGSSLKQLMTAIPQLESLTFACRQLYKLSWLAPASQLTYLSLRDCSLGGDLVKQLAALNLPKLRAVDLSGSKDLGGVRAEQHLQQLTRIAGGKLEQVDLSGWDLGDAGGSSRVLPHLAGLQNLSVLKMECCGLKGWAVPAGQLQSLTHLSLSGNPLDSRGVAAACGLSQLRVLEVAQVACREVVMMPQQNAGTGAGCWAGMRVMPHLTSLNLSGNYWPDSSLPDRSPVPAYRAFKHNLCSSIAAMTRLAAINLSECKAPYSKLTQLLSSLPSSVTEVVLDGAPDGIKTGDILALQALPQLRVLSACGCNVRDKHVGVLCGLAGLQSLVLRENSLGPEGLGELVEGCSGQLTQLDVSGNERLSSKASGPGAVCICGSTCGGMGMCAASVHTGRNRHLLLVRD